MTMNQSSSRAAVLMLSVVCSFAASQKKTELRDVLPSFRRMEVQIPMRDGVKLYTDIYIPKKSQEKLPFQFNRTPYGATNDKGRNGALNGSYREFVADGYIFVFQDIRGRYKSEGQFVMFRPPRDKRDPKAVDESTDTASGALQAQTDQSDVSTSRDIVRTVSSTAWSALHFDFQF